MFEYKQMLGNFMDADELNAEGKQGWEYCGFIPLDPKSLPTPRWKFAFVFKRKFSDTIEVSI